jgi:hypothetical protein
MIKTDWHNRNSQSMEGQRGTADAVPLCLKLNIFRLYRQAGHLQLEEMELSQKTLVATNLVF